MPAQFIIDLQYINNTQMISVGPQQAKPFRKHRENHSNSINEQKSF